MASPKPTAFPTPISATCTLLQGDGTGYAVLATCTGSAPTTADVFQHGCLMLQTDTSTGTGAMYQNIGSVAVPSWSLLDTASASFSLPASATDASTTTGNSFNLTMSALTSGTGLQITAAAATTAKVISLVTPSSAAINVGQAAATPAFQVDASTSSQVAGVKITGAATGGTVAIAAIDSGSATSISLNGKGTGLVSVGGSSTGLVKIGQGSAKQTIQGGTVTALGTTQNSTPTAAQLLGGIVTQTSSTGSGTVTLPLGSDMDAAVSGVANGDSFHVRFANLGGGQTLTITQNTGFTVVGTATVATGTNIDLLCVRTGSNTWVAYTDK